MYVEPFYAPLLANHTPAVYSDYQKAMYQVATERAGTCRFISKQGLITSVNAEKYLTDKIYFKDAGAAYVTPNLGKQLTNHI